MNGIVSILHISDLHRSKGGEISNSALLSSLVSDKERYSISENPKIQSPDIIIVSGDVIRGSTKADGSEIEVRNQYEEAIQFLNDLAEQFLNKNKKRIVIIPGNHDIDWKFSKESMKKIDGIKVLDDKNNLKLEFLNDSINQNSKTRWSWRDLSFYEIVDEEKYNKRLESYANFYKSFYENEREYSLDPKEQLDIFDYPEFNLTIAAFNSCYNNDHLRLVGDIHPDCIAKADFKLREYKRKGRLLLATWHHNTKGLPYDSNYMDNSLLKNFISSGIVLGFHGHQHKTELIHEYSDVIEKKKITVFSAGTLCGGPKELPPGNNRQYNLVELEMRDDKEVIKVNLHVREKTDTSPFNNPLWTAGRIDSKLVSHYSIEIDKPVRMGSMNTLLEIEQLMKQGGYDEAKKRLLKLNLEDDFVRKFLVECVIQTEDFELALTVFPEPKSDEECITILNSAIQLNNKARMKELIITVRKYSSINPTINELIKKIEAIIR